VLVEILGSLSLASPSGASSHYTRALVHTPRVCRISFSCEGRDHEFLQDTLVLVAIVKLISVASDFHAIFPVVAKLLKPQLVEAGFADFDDSSVDVLHHVPVVHVESDHNSEQNALAF